MSTLSLKLKYVCTYMQHRNLHYFCEINFISKNHAKLLLHERSRYSNRAVNFANCIKILYFTQNLFEQNKANYGTDEAMDGM